MKKYSYAFLVAILVLAFANDRLFAQSEIDTTVSLDILTVPNSPAFNLLEISPSAVDRPTTPNDFAISLANASNNFSLLPQNYAIEFLPISFFPKSKNSYSKFTNDTAYVKTWNQKLWNTISQTFIFSGGFSTNDSVKTTTPDFIKTCSGIGFKFSLFRGKIDYDFDQYKNSIDSVRVRLKALHDDNEAFLTSIRENDAVLKALDRERDTNVALQVRIAKEIKDPVIRSEKLGNLKDELTNINIRRDLRMELLKQERMNSEIEYAKELKKSIEQIKFKRYGWMVDFAGGMVIGFRNDDFQNSIVQQYAFWFNGGYASLKGFSFMGVARYSNALNAMADSQGSKMDKAFYDLGGKIEFQTDDNKFSVNGEIIDRISTGTPLLRYTFNAGYQVGKNQALTFSVGKAFAGTAQYGGNLIAALNYVKTLGSKRSIVPSH